MKLWLFCVVATMFPAWECYGQVQVQPEIKLASSVSRADAKSAASAEQRKLAVARVKSLSDTVLGFQDLPIRAGTLAGLANLLWKDDQPYARERFQRAFEFCNGHSESSAADSARLAAVRRRIVALVSTRDPELAKKLIDSPSNESSAATKMDLETAIELLKTKPDAAGEFVERSLRSNIDPGVVTLLKQLRASDQVRADRLFVATLASLAQAPTVDGSGLLLMGTYVFTAPALLNTNDPTAVIYVRVGNVGVADITADRPGIPFTLVHNYLEVAAAILARPVEDPRQQQLYYAAAYILLPKTQRFAPELMSSMATILNNLQTKVPPELTKASSYENVGATDRESFENALLEIEKLPAQAKRDVRYFDLVFRYWSKHDFAKARVAVAKISDRDASAKLTTLIDFAEAARALETGKTLPDDYRAASKLPSGIERAMMWLAITHASVTRKDYSHASDAIATALKTVRGLDDARQPFLLLNASSQLAAFSPDEARTLMIEALRAFNNQKTETSTRVDWREQVGVGPLSLAFPIEVKGVDLEFREMLEPFANRDPDSTIRALEILTNERIKADALLGFAAVLLQ